MNRYIFVLLFFIPLASYGVDVHEYEITPHIHDHYDKVTLDGNFPLRSVVQVAVDVTQRQLLAKISMDEIITVKFDNVHWVEVLKYLAKQYNLDIQIENESILVKRKVS